MVFLECLHISAIPWLELRAITIPHRSDGPDVTVVVVVVVVGGQKTLFGLVGGQKKEKKEQKGEEYVPELEWFADARLVQVIALRAQGR